MSAIAPGPLLDIEDVGDPVAVAQTNFEEITEAIYEFNPSKQNGVETTVIGPPTTGDHLLDELWKDAWIGEWRCTVAGTPGTWRQEKAAIRAGEPNSGTIPTGYLIQDSSDSYRFKIHMGGYVWRPIAPNYFSTLTALTGGAASALDSVVTTSLAVGAVAQFVYNSKLHTYRLRAGTEAETSPWIVRPDDYNGSTNAKVWELADITGYAPDRCFNELTGLTGGTNLDLNSVPTVNMSTGRVIWFLNDGALVAYKLVADVSATSSPTLIRPADFQSVTNPKVWWQILRVSAPGDLMIGTNNLSEIATSTTKRTASRANLDVLWADDTRGLLEGRPARGGLFCDGSAAALFGNPGFTFGTGDFSFSVVLRLTDWTPSTAGDIMTSHGAGNNRVKFSLHTTGTIQLVFFDSGGTGTTYNLTPDVALVDESTYRITVTVDRDGLATLYVNSVNDRDKSGSGPTVNVSASSSIDIGNANANNWGFMNGFPGTAYELLAFNYCLSATQVAKLNAAGTVAYSNQWGSFSASHTSDFSAGVDSYAAPDSGNVTLTGNTDAINGSDNWLKVERTGGTAGRMDIQRSLTTVNGKYFRARFKIYNPSGSPITHFSAGVGGLWETVVSAPANAETVCEAIFTQSVISNNFRIAPVTSGGTLDTPANGTIFYIKEITVTPVGAIQALDLEHALPSQSTAVRDRSSNANHGTAASSGVTQIRDARQLNPSRLTVGASTVLSKLLSATAALNFGSIAAGATAELTITVTGAATGDSVTPGWPSTLEAGLVGIMYVSASNTVTVRLHNTTGSPIDPASQTFRATVLQFA